MCAGHNTRSGVKLSNGPVRRTQIAELTLSPPLLRPRTDARLSDNSNITQPFPQPLHNRFPTTHQPSGTSTRPQPTFNRHATASQPRTNHNRPSCRIHERFRHNHPTSTILESTTLSCMTLACPSTASVAVSLPTPPATRRRSPNCWQWCPERCRRGETQTP